MFSFLKATTRLLAGRYAFGVGRADYSNNQIVSHLLALANTEICADPPSRGLIVGIYVDEEDPFDMGELTQAAKRYSATKCNNRLLEVVRVAGPIPRRGEARFIFGLETDPIPFYSAVAVVGMGKECLGFDSHEMIDERKETIRRSVSIAAWQMMHLRTERIEVESFGHAESAAEGACLGVYAFQELIDAKRRIEVPNLHLYTHKDEICDLDGWRIGLQKAGAQNLCRDLQEMPPNYLTPTCFAEKIIQVLCKTGVNVEVKVEGWAESQQMNGFLAVGRASCETPLFIELSYYGGTKDERPIVLVGQGITYDCGGLNIKKKLELQRMRADMTGAAVVVSTIKAISSLRLPVNIRGLIPLCENVIGCNACKPGDAVKCANGKTISIQGTDHEDVLVLADALLYAQNYCPKYIVDIGTTSGQMRQALDEAASGIFTNSEILWQQIKNASVHTGDRVWRMPLWDYYTPQVTESSIASDVQNYGKGEYGRPCKAAAFLRQFVPCGQWMHIDATNVMHTLGRDFDYLRKGMTGRPTRTVIEFIAQGLCKENHPKITAASS